jgi:DsbC/DsbD-like thiol-disulfide interchange protein
MKAAGSMVSRRVIAGLFAILCCRQGHGQAFNQVVQWTAKVHPDQHEKRQASIVIDLSAEIQPGWHIYGLVQTEGGPTPLKVTLEENPTIRSAGAVTASAPIKVHDLSFDLDTEVYKKSVIVYVPTQTRPSAPAGKQTVSLSVRFQSCDDRVCLPPRTVHLAVPIEITSGT